MNVHRGPTTISDIGPRNERSQHEHLIALKQLYTKRFQIMTTLSTVMILSWAIAVKNGEPLR